MALDVLTLYIVVASYCKMKGVNVKLMLLSRAMNQAAVRTDIW